jgi:hypothetical protein
MELFLEVVELEDHLDLMLVQPLVVLVLAGIFVSLSTMTK